MKHLRCWSAAVIFVPLLASCSKTQPVSPASSSGVAKAAVPNPISFTTRDGIKITPVEVEQDDTGRILGVEKWKFRLSPPKPGAMISYQIEVRRKGKEPNIIYSGGMSVETPTTGILVAFYPLNNDLTHADKLKCFVGTDNSTSFSFEDNPFKGSSGSSRSGLADIQKDGSFLLYEISKDGRHFPDPANTLVVLKISVIKR